MMLVFLFLICLLTITDLAFFRIPNSVVLPGILIGCLFTGYWIQMMAMFFLASLLYRHKFWCGGDVKLMALIGAFLGNIAFPIFALTVVVLKIVRMFYNGRIAVAPYAAYISLFVIEATILIKQWCL